jgi:hypothetical protein
VWAAEFLRDLGSCDWRPEQPTERADYDALIRLAGRCDSYPVDRLLTESHPARAVRAPTVSDDGGLLATGSDAGEIVRWGLPEVRQLKRIDASPGTVTCLAFSPDGDTLVSAGSAGMNSWRLASGTRLAEVVAPCVVGIDELEKALGGDSGTSTRVFGSILTWMQEKTAPCFVVGTANDVASLYLACRTVTLSNG